MRDTIESRRLVLRSEIALTRSALRTEVRDLRRELVVAKVAWGALWLASARLRWISLAAAAVTAFAAMRAKRR